MPATGAELRFGADEGPMTDTLEETMQTTNSADAPALAVPRGLRILHNVGFSY